MAEGDSVVHNCPQCGNPLSYNETSNKMYCANCNRYNDINENESSKGPQPSVVISSSNGAQERCFFCLGFIKDEAEYFECECGNISHETCAKQVGKCSGCGKEYTPDVFLESKDFIKLIEKGKVAFSKKNYQDAVKWYNRALKIKNNSAYAWNCKGMALAGKGQFADAVECYDKALEMKKSHEAYYNKAIILLKMKMFNETIKSINEAISLNRNDARSWYVKGLVFSKMNKPRVAIKCYNTALDLIPENNLFWYAKGKALAKLERYDEALECYETALEINSKDVNVLFEKGRLLSYKNRVDEAIIAFDEVLKWQPQHTGARQAKDDAQMRG